MCKNISEIFSRVLVSVSCPRRPVIALHPNMSNSSCFDFSWKLDWACNNCFWFIRETIISRKPTARVRMSKLLTVDKALVRFCCCQVARELRQDKCEVFDGVSDRNRVLDLRFRLVHVFLLSLALAAKCVLELMRVSVPKCVQALADALDVRL